MSLPDAVAQQPACGACGRETEWDGDVFICEDCLLQFDADTMTASYRHEEADPCGEPCDNWWHGDDRILKMRRFECHPCQLPAGHARMMHWTGCTPLPDSTKE